MKKLIVILFLIAWSFSVYAVPFTLKNSSLTSVGLEIPGIMNPNLSPLSVSGIDLKVDQEIYFF